MAEAPATINIQANAATPAIETPIQEAFRMLNIAVNDLDSAASDLILAIKPVLYKGDGQSDAEMADTDRGEYSDITQELHHLRRRVGWITEAITSTRRQVEL